MRKNFLISLSLLIAAAAVPVAWAHSGHHGGGPMVYALKQVGLSDEQKQSIHQVMEKNKPALQSLHKSQHELRRQFLALDPNAADYSTTVGTIGQQAAALATQRVQLMATIKTQVYAVLTPAQQTQLTTILQNLPEHKRWQGGPPPAEEPAS